MKQQTNGQQNSSDIKISFDREDGNQKISPSQQHYTPYDVKKWDIFSHQKSSFDVEQQPKASQSLIIISKIMSQYLFKYQQPSQVSLQKNIEQIQSQNSLLSKSMNQQLETYKIINESTITLSKQLEIEEKYEQLNRLKQEQEQNRISVRKAYFQIYLYAVALLSFMLLHKNQVLKYPIIYNNYDKILTCQFLRQQLHISRLPHILQMSYYMRNNTLANKSWKLEIKNIMQINTKLLQKQRFRYPVVNINQFYRENKILQYEIYDYYYDSAIYPLKLSELYDVNLRAFQLGFEESQYIFRYAERIFFSIHPSCLQDKHIFQLILACIHQLSFLGKSKFDPTAHYYYSSLLINQLVKNWNLSYIEQYFEALQSVGMYYIGILNDFKKAQELIIYLKTLERKSIKSNLSQQIIYKLNMFLETQKQLQENLPNYNKARLLINQWYKGKIKNKYFLIGLMNNVGYFHHYYMLQTLYEIFCQSSYWYQYVGYQNQQPTSLWFCSQKKDGNKGCLIYYKKYPSNSKLIEAKRTKQFVILSVVLKYMKLQKIN